MFKFIALILILWLDLLQLISSEVELRCTNKASVNKAYCPGEKVIYECNTTHKFLEWTVKGQEVDFSVIDHPGAVEVNTRCNISGILLQYEPFFSSQLMFSAHEELNNSRIQCLDGLDGKSKGCIFEMKAPPDTPHALNVKILNITSVLLEWAAPFSTNHNEIQYRIEATPVVFCDHCVSYEKVVKQTSIQIDGLDIFAGYKFTIKSLNCNGSLESIPIIKSVTPLMYYINDFYDSCSIHFFLNFTWDGPTTDVSLLIQLEYENDDNVTELVNKTTLILLHTSENIVHVEFDNLKPIFFYQWIAVLHYDHKYMTLSVGSFNTSSTCSHGRKKSTFMVSTVAISGSMVFLIVGVVACVVVFGICFWLFWYKTHRTCSTKMEPLENGSEQIPVDTQSTSNQSFFEKDYSNEDHTSYETLDEFPVDSKSKESSFLFYNTVPIEDMLCVSNGYQAYGDITKI